MSAIHTQICLVSAQPDPNFFTCIDSEFRPENLYLLVTPKMKEQADNLERALRGITIIRQVAIKSADDIYVVMETIKELIEESWEKNNGNLEGILVNITGGTKLMSIAAISAAQSSGVRSIYVSIAQNQKAKAFIIPPKSGSDAQNLLPKIEEINLSFPEKHIERYLIAHGCELTRKNPQWNKLTKKENDFVDLVLNKVKDESLITELNRLLGDQEQEWYQKFYFDKNWPEFEEFLKKLDELEWISLENRNLPMAFGIRSKEDFNFLHGRWLEKYIAEVLGEMYPNVQLYNLEVRFNKGENQNEIDVAFFKDKQLFAIEVKTAKLQEDKQNILHKLEAVSEQIGGINAKRCLVSYRTILGNGKPKKKHLDQYSKKTNFNNFLELAHSKKITVIQGKDISNKQALKQKLKEWIEHDDV